MRSSQFKTFLGGLVILLAVLACSFASPLPFPALPTIATFPPVQTAINTATPAPATAIPTNPAATDSATPILVTTAPGVPPFAVAASPSIQSLEMLDANDGWALTDTGVVRTQDGGATWYDVTPGSLNGAPVSPFFLNASTGWLVAMGADPTSGSLYHTSDGGSSWKSVSVPFGGGSLKFVDPMNGWELVGLSAAMSHEAVAIFRTTDGGTTWSKVFTNDPGIPGSSDSLPLVGDKNGITAPDAIHAWVTGAQPSDNFIYVYASQDGGSTWTHQNLAMPAGFGGAMTGPSLPVFFGSKDAVLPVLFFANNNGTDFYVSHDGGQSWSASTPVAQGGSVAAGSAVDFFVWDGGTTLNASHDAGITWSTITPNVNIKDNLVSIQFVNATTGWAVSSDAASHYQLYKTTDGGLTWTVLIP
jgi:photosystem II stability/assembly factor-like uncharacterized protein